mmetsp:Transcript_10195/g.37900  ORF Transcript_10195/g.37900 Transcript_10195/m.37900 type:complete len:200 (-) Transcript_10195:1825-2424(-)
MVTFSRWNKLRNQRMKRSQRRMIFTMCTRWMRRILTRCMLWWNHRAARLIRMPLQMTRSVRRKKPQQNHRFQELKIIQLNHPLQSLPPQKNHPQTHSRIGPLPILFRNISRNTFHRLIHLPLNKTPLCTNYTSTISNLMCSSLICSSSANTTKRHSHITLLDSIGIISALLASTMESTSMRKLLRNTKRFQATTRIFTR